MKNESKSFSRKLLTLMGKAVNDLEATANIHFRPESFEKSVVAVLRAVVMYQEERRRERKHRK